MLGELAAATYKPKFQEHDVDTILSRLFRNLSGVDKRNTFRAQVDIGALHHATSNLESNAEKYCAEGTTPMKSVAMFKSQAEVPRARGQDSVVVSGMTIGDALPESSDGKEKENKRTPIDAVLHVKVSNKLDPADLNKLISMQKRGELSTLFHDGVRVAGERHAARSVGDGLALTKSVIESLYGSLWVELDENQIISFHVAIPILFAAISASAHFKSGVGIIAVDDCPTQRRVMTFYLKKMGIPYMVLGESTEHFTNLYTLSQVFVEQHKIQQLVVILDQNLSEEAPVVLGTQLAKDLRVKCAGNKQDLLTFIRSGNTMSDDINEYLKVADGYLEKNDSYPTMRAKLLAYLSAVTANDKAEEEENLEADLQDMETEAIRELKAIILEGIEAWISQDPAELIENWDTAGKEIHSIKGSIKGLSGMLEESAPDGLELLPRVTSEIDELRALVADSNVSNSVSMESIQNVVPTLLETMDWLETIG